MYGEDEIAIESEVEDTYESEDGESEYEHSLQSGSIGSTDDGSAGNSNEHSQPYFKSPSIDLSSGNVTPDSPELQIDVSSEYSSGEDLHFSPPDDISDASFEGELSDFYGNYDDFF